MTETPDGGFTPGRYAARGPEPPGEEAVVHAVGVGPGPGHLTGRARDLLSGADVVVGFETVVDLVREATDATVLACGYDDEAAALERFADRVAGGTDGVAVLMGDPNVSGYQFLGKVERAVEGPVRVVPGVSSVQVAASRARTPLERSAILSLHRRGPVEGTLDRLARTAGRRHLLVIPRPYDWMPEDLARYAVDHGVDPGLDALVFERLTQPGERTTRSTLGALAGDTGDGPDGTTFSDLSVLVVRAPDSGTGPATTPGGDR
ncbi:MAG: cobalt-precorrin-7 (C(5))-methyltransferase [Haloarculaceae archaeon]